MDERTIEHFQKRYNLETLTIVQEKKDFSINIWLSDKIQKKILETSKERKIDLMWIMKSLNDEYELTLQYQKVNDRTRKTEKYVEIPSEIFNEKELNKVSELISLYLDKVLTVEHEIKLILKSRNFLIILISGRDNYHFINLNFN